MSIHNFIATFKDAKIKICFNKKIFFKINQLLNILFSYISQN